MKNSIVFSPHKRYWERIKGKVFRILLYYSLFSLSYLRKDVRELLLFIIPVSTTAFIFMLIHSIWIDRFELVSMELGQNIRINFLKFWHNKTLECDPSEIKVLLKLSNVVRSMPQSSTRPHRLEVRAGEYSILVRKKAGEITQILESFVNVGIGNIKAKEVRTLYRVINPSDVETKGRIKKLIDLLSEKEASN